MKRGLKDINNIILLIVIAFYVFVQKYLPMSGTNTFLVILVGYLTSLGFYRFFLVILYMLFNNVDYLLKLYYGKSFLKGIWSYTYTVNNKIYFGIWSIKQDLDGINVIGYGFNINGTQRSDVRSVSQLIYNKGAYDIINFREDTVDPEKENYSKTVLHPIIEKTKWYYISYPKLMRAKTYIYGGKLADIIHADVNFRKHENICSENEVKNLLLVEIKNNYKPEEYTY